MNKILFTLLLSVSFELCFSQDPHVQQINKIVDAKTGLAPLHFLASDELKGRSPKRAEIHVAASYISNIFKKSGLKLTPGNNGYLQSFDLKLATPPSSGKLAIGDANFAINKQFLQLRGQDVSINAPIIDAGFGSKDEIEKLDVKGKIVITKFGSSDSSTARQGFAQIKNKDALLAQKGAVALIEIFWQKDLPWAAVEHNFTQERAAMTDEPLPVFLLNSADSAMLQSIKTATSGSITTSGHQLNKLPADNVLGWVEGTDATLKNEYVVLSAHYDHIGVTTEPDTTGGRVDSIYNGARDNAIGATGVIEAAKYFAKHPSRRSILFVLYTAEEMGLIGSRYFSEHPPVPLKQMVFNLNIDNGGYNDTAAAMVIGLGRTSADDDIKAGCAAYHITAIPDQVPELGLFDRSDNLNLAIKGIPAPTFGMGVRSFDDEIKKYYHQLADEVSTFDLRYALAYVRSYVLAAEKIANNPSKPVWIAGDKYEPVAKELYGK